MFDDNVIDEIVEYINNKINIPYVPESVEAMIIKAVITMLFHILSAQSIPKVQK